MWWHLRAYLEIESAYFWALLYTFPSINKNQKYSRGISAVLSPVRTSQNRMPPSLCPETAVKESKPTSIQLAVALCLKVVVWRYVCLDMSQTFRERSAEPDITPCSELNSLTQVTLWAWPTSWWIILWVLEFQTRHVLSLPPATTMPLLISHDNITLLLPPRSVESNPPEAVSHTFTVPSAPPVAIRSAPDPSYLRVKQIC